MTSAAEGGAAFGLSSIPTRPVDAVFARCVPQLDFDFGDPPRYLFGSGRAKRFNPDGVRCIYFSEGDRVADAEYAGGWGTFADSLQPKLTFHARVRIAHVLDLETPDILGKLKVREADLFGPWRLATEPTRLQLLGAAISRQKRIAAIRFPSRAARNLEPPGWNVAIFLEPLRAPDRVEILGRAGKRLEVLP